MVPGELDADVYVVRDFDNHPLEEAVIKIEDMEDWNLSEVDRVDALFAKEMASTGVYDGNLAGGEETDPGFDGKQYTFDKWFDEVDKVSSGVQRPSRVGTLVCSGVYMAVTSKFDGPADGEVGFSVDSHRYDNVPSGVQAFLNRTLDFADKLTKRPMSVIDEIVEIPAKAADAVLKKKR
jgi:hypothetical protein